VRQSLNVESGLNDGICVPLLLIALAVAEAEEQAFGGGHAAGIVLEEIGYGLLGGVAAGVVAALLLRYAEPRRLVAEDWLQVIPLAAAALAYGIAAPLGGSGFVAAFVGGLVFGALELRGRTDVTYLTDATGLVLAAVTFVVFGASVLSDTLHVVGWQIVLYAVLSLTVLRMVPVWLALRGTHARGPTIAFAGWFGPRGLASIVFAVLVLEGADLEHGKLMVATAVIAVALSVFAHGASSVPLTNAYVRWFEAQVQPPVTESLPATEVPWRSEHLQGREKSSRG
jgi:NhaP-type Na+/H+ or K+/H+ antiporter